MLTEQEILAAIDEWFTGRLTDGTRSSRVGWRLDKRTRELKRFPVSTDMLASFLARPEHMVRVSLSDGKVRIEVEERDEASPTKGAGNPFVYFWEHPTDRESMSVITHNSLRLISSRE